MIENREERHCSQAWVMAYIALGSNLDDPVSHVTRALADLEQLPATRSLRHSKLYTSTPMGSADQPDYINAVALISTRLTPNELLCRLQSIEEAHGRCRTTHWGPRTLDLDILLFGNQQIASRVLTIPHPGLHERAFVLYPLREIAPGDLHIPGRGFLSGLLVDCSPDGIEPLNLE